MIFPPDAATASVVVNGTVIAAYRKPYVVRGHVLAPLDPFVWAVAASIEIDGDVVIVRRGDRFAQARLFHGYVALAPVLRTLGLRVRYDAALKRVCVTVPNAPLATPTPFNVAVPHAPPRAVFTPSPAPTDKPIVVGKPRPRRTPLPFATPRPTSEQRAASRV